MVTISGTRISPQVLHFSKSKGLANLRNDFEAQGLWHSPVEEEEDLAQRHLPNGGPVLTI